ncbi:unnamed protein product [Spirodela intermedia]|uniref:DYW domain-containing protein n=1 Tax=Spirodela intermedia TaxID=51605 RepID=A0A7I8KEE0_SPIIN|nr:unnamed protein product [Spirodela intermedia]
MLDRIPKRDIFAWNALIRARLADRKPSEAILIYCQMLLRGVNADNHTFPRILNAARLGGAFFSGRQVHGHVLKLGLGSDDFVVTALVSMYGDLDGPCSARKILDGSSRRNPVSWTLLMGMYSDQEKPNLALKVFYEMAAAGVPLDSVALATALGASGRLRSVLDGKKIHDLARKSGLELHPLVANVLVKMYFDCEVPGDARALFDRMPAKDMVSWTTVISGAVHTGAFNEGLKLFRELCAEGRKPDHFTVSSVLPACARMSASRHGREIHGYTIRHGVGAGLPAVQNALMDMFVKSGRLESAQKIFFQMAEKDVVSWTVMIMGYSLHGRGEDGVKLFREMERDPAGVAPDAAAYYAVLHACHTACMVEQGRFFFGRIRKPGVEHVALLAGLLARAGKFEAARTFVEKRRMEDRPEVLRAVLDGCRIHRNLPMGKRTAEKLAELEPLNAENYVLLSNIHAAGGRWGSVEGLRRTIRDMGLRTKQACSWIEVGGKFHVFRVGDVFHPRSVRIRWELDRMMEKMREEGLSLDADFSLHDVDEERESIPAGHSELLAIAFGLISTPVGAVIRVTKNLRLCRSCHASAKHISWLTGRDILLKDPLRFHHFRDGECSCRDLW